MNEQLSIFASLKKVELYQIQIPKFPKFRKKTKYEIEQEGMETTIIETLVFHDVAHLIKFLEDIYYKRNFAGVER